MKRSRPKNAAHELHTITIAPGITATKYLSALIAAESAACGGEKITIIAGAHSCVTIIDDLDPVNHPDLRLQIIAQPHAQVKFIRDYSDRLSALCVRHEDYRCMRGSRVEVISVQRGGGQRFIDARVYTGAHFFARDVYALEHAQKMNAHITHAHVGHAGVADTASLAIVRDSAHMRCEGAIIVGKVAKNAVSSLQQKVILLGQGSSAYMAPAVVLKQGTVKCTHSVACSPLDDELTWLLSARGVAAQRAVDLLLYGMVHAWVGTVFSHESIERFLTASAD